MEDKAMRLNTISPADGAKQSARRVGRGIGSGLGKTAGRGHKGQRARSGGYHKVGFEGGQMPMQRRIPKRGFVSTFAPCITIRLDALNVVDAEEIDILALKTCGLLRQSDTRVKVVLKGTLSKKIALKDIEVSAGAKAAIEKLGGTVMLTPSPEKVRKLPKKALA